MTKRAAAAAGEVLDRRALNRALLARQLLLRREQRSAINTIEHLVGMQAQIPTNPYVALFARLDGFRHDELSELVGSRKAVRITLMRATIHLASPRDALALRPLMQPVITRMLQGSWHRQIAGVDIEALAASGRALLQDQARTAQELGPLLAEQWPGRDPLALATAVRVLVPLVQVPPRGMWGGVGQASHICADAWLRGKRVAPMTLEKMVLRYLAAFGPASIMDVQNWCGLTRLRDTVEALRPKLRTFRDEKGRELFDLPDAPCPDADTPAPPRFLPEYDNVTLGHADRTRIVPEAHRDALVVENGLLSCFLLDGFVAGQWRTARERGVATMSVAPIVRLSKADRLALEEEAERVLAFTDGDATRRIVKFVPQIRVRTSASAQRDS